MRLKKYKRTREFPLRGLRFLVTRQDYNESSISKILKSKGASVMMTPMSKIVPPKSWELFDEAVSMSSIFDWVVFTSCNGVSGCFKRLKELEFSPEKFFSKMKIACVGKSTANRLVENGLNPDLVPELYQTEGLISVLSNSDLSRKTFWLIQAESPRKLLIKNLKKRSKKVIFTPVYRSEPIVKDYEFLINELKSNRIDWVLFASPSAVKIFQKILPSGFWFSLSKIPKIGCIGLVTAKVVNSFGWEVQAIPKIQDFEHLVKKICEINLKN